MFCARCRSTGVKHINGALVCKECGYEKKGIQVAEDDNDFVPGAFGKHLRKVGYVTEKRQAEPTKGQAVDVDLRKLPKNERLMMYLGWYQDVLLKAASTFAESLGCEENVQHQAKQLWMAYLKSWMALRIPLPSFFSLINNQQKGWEPDDPIESDLEGSEHSDLEQVPAKQTQINEENASSECSQERQEKLQQAVSISSSLHDEPLRITEDFDLNYKVKVHFDAAKPIDPESIIVSEAESATQVQLNMDCKQKQKSQTEVKAQSVRIVINQLTKKLCLSGVHDYFAKLCKIPQWTDSQLKLTAKNYCSKMFMLEHPNERIRSNRLINFQLSKMLLNRNISEMTMRERGIINAIFCYDLLLNTCPECITGKPALSFLYEEHQKIKETRPLLRMAFRIVRKILAGGIRKKTQTKMPFLNYKLIYSFIHLSCLMLKQPYYLSEIIERTNIEPARQPWLNLKFMEIGQSPSESRVRRTTIQLCSFLDCRPPMMAGKWIQKVLSQLQLEEQTRYVCNLYKTLMEESVAAICREDVLVLAVLLIHFKLAVGLDNQPHIAVLDMDEIRQHYNINNELKSIKVAGLCSRINQIPRLRELTRLKLKDILNRIKQANRGRERPLQLNDIKDLQYISSKDLTTITDQLEKWTIDSNPQPQKLERKYGEFNALFTSIPVKRRPLPSPIEVIDLTAPRIQSYNFKQTVVNQLPWQLKKLAKNDESLLNRALNSLNCDDIPLPCRSYETIANFKSVYRCLPRDELFVVLQGLAHRRCDIDSLWSAVELLELSLVKYENEEE